MFHKKTLYGVFYALLALILAVLPLVSGCGGGGGGGSPAPPAPPPSTAQWTYMVYMGADNNLSYSGLKDLNEMESVGSTGDMQIVLQAEFSSRYTPGVPTNTLRFLVQKDNNPDNVNLNAGESIGNVDMGNPATLTAFIQWAKQKYPAEHYALVIWDHGGGWKDRLEKQPDSMLRGAVQDETSGSFMSLPDLAKAVRDSGVHFDVINFDACLMAMYEVAYEFKGLTDYMVFSEQTEPGDGDPYDTILSALASDPSMNAQSLAKMIVDKYNLFFANGTRESTTKAAVDMARLSTLDTNLLALITALKNDNSSLPVMQAARSNTLQYAYKSNHDIWQVCDYLGKSPAGTTVKSAAAEVKTAITSMVINNKTTGSDMANSRGLAVYLPLASETNASQLADYAKLACNQTRAAGSGTWGSYIDTLLAGAATAQYGPGNFGLYLTWTSPTSTSTGSCDADLDLYVWEPLFTTTGTSTGQWYAPWMGQTSPNGFFSSDSAASGLSAEYYLANKQVLKGDYFFVINYYGNGKKCTQAKAYLYVYDPSYFGDSNWHHATSAELHITLTYPSPHLLDLSNRWTGQTLTSMNDLNKYSDWWTPFYRSVKELEEPPYFSGEDLPTISKGTQMILRFKKEQGLSGALE